ncbi:MAG TPA: plastocyanin/azurin family copper-binding protein [Dictyobacter sp.]|jgi:plastocyanin|nr:plastocyanin/azurin family copper-binding protein [Dictyobacter sp.]
MTNLGPGIIGVVLVLIVIGGLLFIFFSRSNAVQKTGAGSLIMLAIVSLMIPVLWIIEGNNQVQASNSQFVTGVERGMETYAAQCTDQCYGIVNGKVVNPTYNGYSMSDFAGMTDSDVQRIIGAGIYNPKAIHQPSNPEAVPKSDEYGGALLSNDLTYLFDLIRSTDPSYLKKNGLPPVANGFNGLPGYLQENNPSQYASAVTLGKNGQFGQPVDMTKQNAVTINIVDVNKGATCQSATACYGPISVQVKVGTVITWVNNSSVPHTVTAINSSNLSSPTPEPQIFDSAKGNSANTIPSGGKFSWTVTQEAYNLDPTTHQVVYYCRIHPDMLAQITIVP